MGEVVAVAAKVAAEVDGGEVASEEVETADVKEEVLGVHEGLPGEEILVDGDVAKEDQLGADKVSTVESNLTENTVVSEKNIEETTDVVSEETTKVIVEEAEEELPPKVILYQFPPGEHIPNLSPFCLKLETFLRINSIPYENQYGYKMGKKGKLPWIEYKGERVADSNIIVHYLNEKFEIDLDKNFSSEEVALGRAVKCMLEENTYWVLIYDRYVENFNEYKKLTAPPTGTGIGFNITQKMFQRKMRSNLDAQGLGRHSKEELYVIGENDLKAVSDIFVNKDFLLGDRPSTFDCTVFGLCANVLYSGFESPLATYMKENAANLCQFCDRMKSLYWVDWADAVVEKKSVPTVKKSFSFKKKNQKAGKSKDAVNADAEIEIPDGSSPADAPAADAPAADAPAADAPAADAPAADAPAADAPAADAPAADAPAADAPAADAPAADAPAADAPAADAPAADAPAADAPAADAPAADAPAADAPAADAPAADAPAADAPAADAPAADAPAADAPAADAPAADAPAADAPAADAPAADAPAADAPAADAPAADAPAADAPAADAPAADAPAADAPAADAPAADAPAADAPAADAPAADAPAGSS